MVSVQCTSRALRIVQCRLRSPHGPAAWGASTAVLSADWSRCRDNQSNPHTGPPPVWPVLLAPHSYNWAIEEFARQPVNIFFNFSKF